MLSDSCSESRENSGDNVFDTRSVSGEVEALARQYLATHDFAKNSRRAVVNDLRKFARWFVASNREPLTLSRVTVRDVTDFREHLRRKEEQAVATVNRCLITLRRFFGWLVDQKHLDANPVSYTHLTLPTICSV